jgi:hypothetical protein
MKPSVARDKQDGEQQAHGHDMQPDGEKNKALVIMHPM